MLGTSTFQIPIPSFRNFSQTLPKNVFMLKMSKQAHILIKNSKLQRISFGVII